MNGLELTDKPASYMREERDGIQIISPVAITNAKGQIGLHLQGLCKPKNRLNLQFTPTPNVLAIKLEWSVSGAILYFQPTKNTVKVGQPIGTLSWQPYAQMGKTQPTTNTIRFRS